VHWGPDHVLQLVLARRRRVPDLAVVVQQRLEVLIHVHGVGLSLSLPGVVGLVTWTIPAVTWTILAVID
jgi:hypothetical protein